MKNEEKIDVLNTLVEINNDRIEGYVTASSETDEHELKTLFAQFARTSNKCKNELESEIIKLGGKPTESTKTTGKFFRVWMDVKTALTGKDRKTILNLCEFGEDQALKTYEKALKDDVEDLNTPLKMLITSQYELIKADHNLVKSMRDTLVTTS